MNPSASKRRNRAASRWVSPPVQSSSSRSSTCATVSCAPGVCVASNSATSSKFIFGLSYGNPVTYSLAAYSRLMVRVSGLDVTEGHDESYHSTKADDRQNGLAGIQLLSFNQLQFCGEEGDPHSLRGTHLPLDCETHQTVPHHLRIAQQQAPAVRQGDT